MREIRSKSLISFFHKISVFRLEFQYLPSSKPKNASDFLNYPDIVISASPVLKIFY